MLTVELNNPQILKSLLDTGSRKVPGASTGLHSPKGFLMFEESMLWMKNF